MGLGGGPSWTDDYEWFHLADVPDTPVPARGRRRSPRTEPVRRTPLGAALCAALTRQSPWPDTDRDDRPGRLLLVDLDNLRAHPARWKARMAVVVMLAREADHVALAGQSGPVERALPLLEEFADAAVLVPDGSDLADHELLAAAVGPGSGDGTVLVMSNDGIFADLADDRVLGVLSPGGDALSDRLANAADRVMDLAALEAGHLARD